MELKEDNDLLARVAWLIASGKVKQADIAKIFGVSPSYINRIVAQAYKQGLIYVQVDATVRRCLELELKLRQLFPQLNICHVVPDAQTTAAPPSSQPFNVQRGEFDANQMSFHMVGMAAARLLAAVLTSNKYMTIGVAKGRSVSSFIKNLPYMDLHKTKFVSIVGNLTRSLGFEAGDSIHELSQKTQSTGYFLPVPYVCESPAEKHLFLKQRALQDLLSIAKQAHLYIVGLGCFLDPQSHIVEEGYIPVKNIKMLQSQGVVGDIAGNLIDANGHFVKTTYQDLFIGLSLEDLRGKRVAALVGGTNKGPSILPSLRCGVLTDIILGECAASEALGEKIPK